MFCFHCLLTFFGGTLCVPFGLWGLLARNAGRPLLSLRDISPTPWGNLPAPRRKLLKKLEQNFYVLLTFGSYHFFPPHTILTERSRSGRSDPE